MVRRSGSRLPRAARIAAINVPRIFEAIAQWRQRHLEAGEARVRSLSESGHRSGARESVVGIGDDPDSTLTASLRRAGDFHLPGGRER